MLRHSLFFVLLVQLALGYHVEQVAKFKDCGSKAGTLVGVDVIPCDSSPCTLYKGEEAQIVVKFTTKKPIDQGTVSVHGILAHIPVPFPLEDSDLCKFTSPSCPLQPNGIVYTYSYRLPIQAAYPSLRLTVKWELKSASGEDIVCALIPVQIHGR